MKRIHLILPILLAAAIVLGGCQTATPAPTEAPPAAASQGGLPDLGGREVRIAFENAYIPFQYIELATGKAGGWEYDAWNEICRRLNCKPVYVETGWEGMIQAVADKQFDAGADGISITDERAQVVDFSTGYISIDQRLLTRIDEDRFADIEEFVADEKLTMGAQTGSTNYETALKYVPEERIKAFEQFSFAVQALVGGDVDAVLGDETAGQGYLGENKDQVKLIGPKIKSEFLGFIFPKGSDLVDPVNQALKAMMADGFLDKLNKQYFGPDFNLSYDEILLPTQAP